MLTLPAPHTVCATSADPQLVGDPVDTLTGSVFDGKLEFRLTGPLELWWWRYYDSSLSGRPFALGWGHSHEFDRTLRFDLDGFSYEGPIGRRIGFAPLTIDGTTERSKGFILRRSSIRRYEVFHHGEPAMEFEFHHPQQPARLIRVFRDDAEIRFHYGEAYQLKRIVDSAGRLINVVEEDGGLLISLTIDRGPGQQGDLLIAYKYDARGDLVAITHANGHGYTFAYDDVHRMIRRTGRKGFTFSFEYDEHGRCIKATGDDRLYEVSLEYTVPGRVTKVTRADGGVWTYFFDEVGGLTQIHDPLGGVQEFVRDRGGRVIKKVDPAGNATQVIYDAAGAAVAEVSPLGHRFPLPRNPNEPDPRAHRVAANMAEYELGRVVVTKDIALPTSTEAMRLELPDSVRGLVWLQPDEKAAAHVTRKFDVRPLGAPWWPEPSRERIFDDFGKLVAQQDSFGRRREWTYDVAGNLAQYVDFDGSKWHYYYGSWHLLRVMTDPLGSEVTFSYTEAGKIATCVDPGGTRSEYEYDTKDHLVQVRRHGRVRETYTRDAAGNLIAKYASDRSGLVSLQFGAGNVPARRALSSGDEHNFEYDERGRYLTAATKTHSVEFGYDGLGNRVRDERNGLGVKHRFERRHKLVESVMFDRFRVRYRRDEDGTLVITDPGGKSHRVRVLSNGLVERRFSNGMQEFIQYDVHGRCLMKSARHGNGSVWNRRYHWSGEGELRRVEDNGQGEIRHEYDAAHRLARRFLPSGRVEDYSMDPAGNLVRQPGMEHVALQEGNRLRSVNGATVDYNERNHISTRISAAESIRYVYDSRDQLIGVETPSGTWTAAYDALGRRTGKTWMGRTIEFYWSTDQLIAEVSNNGRARLYVYADPLAMTPLLFLEYDSLDSAPESCQRYFILADQIGTPTVIENESGVVWRAHIEPFGRAHVMAGAAIEFNLRFPGHYFDVELGLHYNRFRYYDPSLGRYLQSDPWGTAGGINLYAYRANPLLSVDVRGLGDDSEEGGQPCHETPDDGEGMWAKTLAALPDDDGEDPRPPIPWDKVEESRGAFVAARDAKDDLGGNKTVAAAGDGMYASGQKPTEGFDHVDPTGVRRTLDPGSDPQASSMFPPADQTPTASGGTQPAFKDQGDPGSYNACHGEMQAAAAQPGSGIGVSQDMCPNCGGNAAPQIARNTGEPVVITDPQGTHVFHPDGSYHGPDDHPDLGPIPRE